MAELKVELKDLFVSLRKEKKTYLKTKKGTEFEDRIEGKLKDIGFTRINKNDLQDYKEYLKKEVLKKEKEDLVKNTTNLKSHFVCQPNGKQNYPDFLVLSDKHIFCLEVKFSEHQKENPFWNSGLPRPNGIYIFGSHGLEDLTFFMGCDVVSLEEVRKLHDFFDKGLPDYQDSFNNGEMKGQKKGFGVYVRKAFNQSKKHNPNADINFFSSKEREKLEKNVIQATG